jgi:hypothetical protein
VNNSLRMERVGVDVWTVDELLLFNTSNPCD